MKQNNLSFALMLAFVTILFVSCGGRNSCKKNVIKELKASGREYIPKDMNDAIARYDFEAARMFATCDMKDDLWYGEGDNTIPPELTRAEVSYKIQQGNYGLARSTAREDGHPELFGMMYMDAVGDMLSNGEYDNVLGTISSWNFTYSPNDEYYYCVPDNIMLSISPNARMSLLSNGRGWQLYNIEAEKYNNLIDKLIAYYSVEGDEKNVKKCLALYAPITTQINDSILHQENKAYDQAVKRLK